MNYLFYNKKINVLILPFAIVLSIGNLYSCSFYTNKELQYAFELAGENKNELEHVLNHYEQNDADSLKLRAAKFLIINLPHCYSIYGSVIDSIKKTAAQLKPDGRFSDSAVNQWNDLLQVPLPRIYDAKVITAQFLISNIDNAFSVWRTRKWAKYYSFQEFCEYILPYRVGNEPLENWRQLFLNKYGKFLDSLYDGDDVVEAARIVAKQLKKEGFSKTQDMNYPNLGGVFLFKNRSGRCRETCDIALYAMRSLGIPIATDKYIISPAYHSKHFWTTIIDTDKKSVPFLYNEDEITRERGDHRKKGKVYRETFGINPERFQGLYTNKGVPAIFRDPYLKDVSDSYFTGHITVAVSTDGNDERYRYLCVFDGRDWTPIDIGEIRKQQVTFNNVEQNIIYKVIALGSRQIPCNYPFIFVNNHCNYLIPDKEASENVRLTRKYPVMLSLIQSLSTAIGVTINASADIKFGHSQQLFKVIDTPSTGVFILDTRKFEPFRYVRYSSPTNQFIQLAELHFYSDTTMKNEVLAKIKGINTIDYTHQGILQMINDDDRVSFYMSAQKGEQLLFDLGANKRIKKIMFAPRNDDNFVKSGDRYDLYYQTDTGWKLLGSQTSVSDKLLFTGVPRNALLWLHDNTGGNEEQVFVYRNGKQIFTYDLN